MTEIVKLRPRWCLYPRGLCALCLHRHNLDWPRAIERRLT